jgi:outer membrane protein OmpA-like peptidoglycan-associated protein
MKKFSFNRKNVATAVACFAVFFGMSLSAQAQEPQKADAQTSAVISRKMNSAAEAIRSIEGAKLQSVTDDNGLPSILATFDTGILFATGNADLGDNAKSLLSRLARTLADNPAIAIEVIGHTDNLQWRNSNAQQSEQKNQELSEQRARSVVSYLKSQGVADNQFTLVEGKGQSKPVADNATAEGRSANRRVELYLLASDRMITEAVAEVEATKREASKPQLDTEDGAPYKTGIGVIVGSINGLSFKTFFSPSLALQADLGMHLTTYSYASLSINPNLVFQKNITKFKHVGRLDWLAGGGLSGGYTWWGGLSNFDLSYGYFKYGINAIGGAELTFGKLPLAVQFDFRPGYSRISSGWTYDYNSFDWSVNLSVRYILSR